MSTSPEQFAAMLLAGFGGQPCRDSEHNTAGVWLPLQSWHTLASIARNHDRGLHIAANGRAAEVADEAPHIALERAGQLRLVQ